MLPTKLQYVLSMIYHSDLAKYKSQRQLLQLQINEPKSPENNMHPKNETHSESHDSRIWYFVDFFSAVKQKGLYISACCLFCRYLDENIRVHIRNPRPNLKDDVTFIDSNRMHGEINTHVQKEFHGTFVFSSSHKTVFFVCVQPLMAMCMVTWTVWTWRWEIRCTGT